MIRNVVTLTLNDLAIAFNNKTLLLVIFIPLFVFFSLKLVDQTDADFQLIRVGLLENSDYFPEIIQSIQSADQLFEITWLADIEAGELWLKDKKIDGVLVNSTENTGSLDLVVLTKASFQTLTIVEGISALQNAYEGKDNNWVANIRALHDSEIQKQTLPTWILMLVLLVGFIVLPAQIAEEKEKYLLLGLLQTPIHELEWLTAKLLLGMILIGLAVGLLHLLGGFSPGAGGGLAYIAFLLTGGFCFSAAGILLGFLCRTQSSARSLGVLFYLPNLLPAALSDFSQKLTGMAPVFPSYQFYGPVKSILLEGNSFADFTLDWLYLFCVGVIMTLLSWLF
ncbi:MAG: ABC transporter permease, partial [Gammaproteobacteria bacterium]